MVEEEGYSNLETAAKLAESVNWSKTPSLFYYCR